MTASARISTHSYRRLERRVEALSSELEQVDRERLRGLEAQERLSHRLRSVLDSLPGGIVVLDRRGCVIDCNPAAREMLGEPLLGLRWLEVIRRCFAPRSDDGHEISLHSGRRLSVATRSLDGDHGQLVLLTDQTETRQLQDRLSRHQRLTAMGRMLAALAHQIRTPLAAAMLHASNLVQQDVSPEQTRRFAQRILSRLTHMEHQLRDMLIFVRGDVRVDEPCTVGGLRESLELATEDALRARESRCDWHLDCDPATDFRCNRDALVGAIVNLVTNGLQAAGPGCTLAVRIALHEGRLGISVCDNGPGMTPEVLRQLDEAFFTTKPQGTGLGIAVVRAVARAHGGELDIRSAPGQGTCATILIPAGEASRAHQE